ncbi:MAG: polysaccharide deacetylase family protein [Lachnospiraceae bacterium]|nr:polysaccharide deacetylase family protein [Lachnospiraceae bacterium]
MNQGRTGYPGNGNHYKKKKKKKRRQEDLVQLGLKALIAVAAAGLLFCLGYIFVQSVKDQKKSNELPDTQHVAQSGTPQISPSNSGGEETPTPTETPAPTETPTPTATPVPTATPTPDPSKKRVAFSFDDGPHYELTRKFVDELKKYNGHATWFLVGNRMYDEAAEGIRYASENGNEIGIHGWTHALYYDTCTDKEWQEELSKTKEVIEQYTGKTPTLMRPFGGRITKERTASCEFSVILWSVDSEDWRLKSRKTEEEAEANVQKIVDNVLKNVGDGDIILMHEIYENSYEAFCILAKKLSEQGYEFVTVSELLGDPVPGTKYSRR